MKSSPLLAAVAAAAALAACGTNHNGTSTDAPGGSIDAASVDGPIDIIDGAPDGRADASVDAAVDAKPDATPTPSDEIAAARAHADGTGLSLSIHAAIVTYLKPALGNPTNDPAGFTIQAEKLGPALFIAVDPTTLTPAPKAGDTIAMTITTMATTGLLRKATAVTGFSVTASGADLDALTQDLGAATDVVAKVGDYESELVDVSGTVSGDFTTSGQAFDQGQLATAGIPSDANLRVRLPSALRDALDLEKGCTLALHHVPMNRFNAAAEPNGYGAGDVTVSACPAPVVASAVSLSPTSVRLTFSRRIDPASVVADGSQFSFDNGLTATAATVADRTITLVTAPQTGGTTYTVTAAATLIDLRGIALGTPSSSTFGGFVVPAQVRINELNANIAGGCDLVELRVIAGGSMTGFKLQERDTETLVTFPAFNVATNDLIVVHMNKASATCNPKSATQEVTTVTDQPAASFTGNYDTAFDFWSADTGLTATDNVITLYDSAGAIIDAVLVAKDPTGTAATASETQAAAVALANQWQMVGGGVPTGGFVDDAFNGNAALDLNGTGTAASGSSIQRLDDTDDNDKADWNSASVTVQAQTFGALNVGQAALPIAHPAGLARRPRPRAAR